MLISNQQDEDMLSTVHIRAPITELALAYDNPGSTMVFLCQLSFQINYRVISLIFCDFQL
jgi:hypothetical protein